MSQRVKRRRDNSTPTFSSLQLSWGWPATLVHCCSHSLQQCAAVHDSVSGTMNALALVAYWWRAPCVPRNSSLMASVNREIFFSLDISAKNKHAASSRFVFLAYEKSASVSASILITHTHTLHYTTFPLPSYLTVLYPLLCSLMPVLAGTSPWHGPCWLKWQISSSADRAEQQRWGFSETFNPATTLAVDMEYIGTHVWLDFTVAFIPESVKEICISALVTTVSGDFVWLTPDTWLQQLAEAKKNQCKDRQGYSPPQL